MATESKCYRNVTEVIKNILEAQMFAEKVLGFCGFHFTFGFQINCKFFIIQIRKMLLMVLLSQNVIFCLRFLFRLLD